MLIKGFELLVYSKDRLKLHVLNHQFSVSIHFSDHFLFSYAERFALPRRIRGDVVSNPLVSPRSGSASSKSPRDVAMSDGGMHGREVKIVLRPQLVDAVAECEISGCIRH